MTKTLKLSDNKAKELYKTASSELKEILEETFGKEFFIPKKITDIIKTIEDVYDNLGIIRELPYKRPTTKQQRSLNAIYDIQNITKCLNEDDTFPNFNDGNQYKYYPYFVLTVLGGVVDSWSYYGDSYAHVGFGFCFKTSDLALFAGKQFITIYKDYFPE